MSTMPLMQCNGCGKGWARSRRLFVRLVNPADRSLDRVLCQGCAVSEKIRHIPWRLAGRAGEPYMMLLCPCGAARRSGVLLTGPEEGQLQALCQTCAQKLGLNLLFHPRRPRPVATRFHVKSLAAGAA